ncbi:MAG: Gfo/Idh/MocA family oxidoreductase [Bacteroidales bacterium]|nr:Gfo/Idh/MocA family oxidoreductase [Bacteroidales bacterium]MDT8431596.1 Gfo/Idh/MocA family oxidoreductase [Bacteroidales bacterium]
MKNQISRRKFIGTAAATAAGFTILPSNVIAGLGHKAPSDKLNIVGIGVGGKGFTNLKNMESENIVALCDVDWKYSKKVFDYWPKAKRYKDWREMYDEMHSSFDAVVIATADHTHAITAGHAMTLGKHVYLQKPLTHTVYESRLMTKLAETYRVATQMGNEGASGNDTNLVIEWLHNGEIGEVTKVDSLSDRPIWPQGLSRPQPGMWVPETLDWELFVGPAPMRPYHELYTPWNWRGWWDFGTGALGDMACHIMHPAFLGLHLGHPVRTQGSSTMLLTECAPVAQIAKFTFPERKQPKGMKMNLPEVELTWYDGGLKPMMPAGWPPGKNLSNGLIFHGSKDTLVCDSAGGNPMLLSGRIPDAPTFRRRVPTNHEMDWVRACKENPENRTEAVSHFAETGPFNEIVVMGVLAVRLQNLNKELEWDGEKMEFTNINESETIRTIIEDGFSIHEGHPTFDKKWSEPVNASAFAKEMISHTYRDPWKLPEMPG